MRLLWCLAVGLSLTCPACADDAEEVTQVST